MSLLSALLSLSVCLFIQLARANWAPCLPTKNSGYRDFLKRYLSSGTPASLNHKAWEAYLKQHTDCDGYPQYFFSPEDRYKVEAICTGTVGKHLSWNHCISKNKFTFIFVNYELDTCIVWNITRVTQHIIVTCDMVEDGCRPTRLTVNQGNITPRQEDPVCARPVMSHGFRIRAAGHLCLLLTLLAPALCYLTS